MRGRKCKYVPIEEAVSLYHEGWSAQELESRYREMYGESGAGRTTILRAIEPLVDKTRARRARLKRHPPIARRIEFDEEAAYAEYVAGDSLKVVAAKYGVSQDCLQYRFLKAGKRLRAWRESYVLAIRSQRHHGYNVNTNPRCNRCGILLAEVIWSPRNNMCLECQLETAGMRDAAECLRKEVLGWSELGMRRFMLPEDLRSLRELMRFVKTDLGGDTDDSPEEEEEEEEEAYLAPEDLCEREVAISSA